MSIETNFERDLFKFLGDLTNIGDLGDFGDLIPDKSFESRFKFIFGLSIEKTELLFLPFVYFAIPFCLYSK